MDMKELGSLVVDRRLDALSGVITSLEYNHEPSWYTLIYQSTVTVRDGSTLESWYHRSVELSTRPLMNKALWVC